MTACNDALFWSNVTFDRASHFDQQELHPLGINLDEDMDGEYDEAITFMHQLPQTHARLAFRHLVGAEPIVMSSWPQFVSGSPPAHIKSFFRLEVSPSLPN